MITIVGAAIRYKELIITLPKPNRHHHILQLMFNLGIKGGGEFQGFITSEGKYIDRKEAITIAMEAGQCKNGKPELGYMLFSEDLW